MAVIKDGSRYQMKVDYKTSYDTSGNLPEPDWQQTLSYVDEGATLDQLAAFVDGIVSLTVYRDYPYRRLLVDTSELVQE